MDQRMGTEWVYEDEYFTLEAAGYCAVPGYLILRSNGPAISASAFGPEEAARYGVLYVQALKAIEEATGADRVYTLVFAEMDRRFHVHLFPRTRWMLLEYWRAHGCEAEAANGPLLFEWARTRYVEEAQLPQGVGSPPEVLSRIRQLMAQ